MEWVVLGMLFLAAASGGSRSTTTSADSPRRDEPEVRLCPKCDTWHLARRDGEIRCPYI